MTNTHAHIPRNSHRLLRILVGALAVATLLTASHGSAARILDLCDVDGARPNQLIGYGLVVGLANTGDTGQSRFTVQSTAAMLRRLGATIDPTLIQTRNAAAVMVTATLPAFIAPGQRIDVHVSSLGNARSLAGGVLLQTPLLAGDRAVYAVAQGPVVVGGYGASGSTGSSVRLNHLTTGRVPSGAIVEREVARSIVQTESTPPAADAAEEAATPTTTEPNATRQTVVLTLRSPSFITAQRIAEAITTLLGAEARVSARTAGVVEVVAPPNDPRDATALIAALQILEVEPENRARIVIDERTGTIVIGAGVRIREAAVAQGSLRVEIQETLQASQPTAPFGQGSTAVVPNTRVDAQNASPPLRVLPTAATLADVVAALNVVGASPRELIAVLQALRSAGALEGEIDIQ